MIGSSSQSKPSYIIDGDDGFKGLNSRDNPTNLEKGFVSKSQNFRLERGEATLRKGIKMMSVNGVTQGQLSIYASCNYTDQSGNDYIACFNPKVIQMEGEAHMEEGCLTFPLLMLRVTRPKTIKVEYQDFTGVKREATFDGISARIFLHELDHMNGILYTDRVKPLALKSGLKKVEKFYRKYFNPQMMKRLIDGNQKTNS